MIKTHYDHHEDGYQRRKSEGKPQWSDETQLNRDTRRLSHLLKHIHELLLPGGVFVGATMCGEVQGEDFDMHFNQETRPLTRQGIAIRHIGTEESLLSEFSAAGLVTLTHGIKHLGEESPDAEEFYFLLQKK